MVTLWRVNHYVVVGQAKLGSCLYIHVQAHSSLDRPCLMLTHDARQLPKLPTSFFRVYQALALFERVRTQLDQLFTAHAFQTQSRVTGNLPPGVYDPPVFRGGASRARRKTEKGYNLLFASREGAASALNQLLR